MNHEVLTDQDIKHVRFRETTTCYVAALKERLFSPTDLNIDS